MAVGHAEAGKQKQSNCFCVVLSRTFQFAALAAVHHTLQVQSAVQERQTTQWAVPSKLKSAQQLTSHDGNT